MPTKKDARTSTDVTTTRRGFIGALGAAVAVTALPLSASAGATPSVAAPLDPVRSWYTAAVDRIVRGWEPRFRFRQYRPDEEDSVDYEEREGPRSELADALYLHPLLRDAATACLVLAVSPQEYEDAQKIQGQASWCMASDALEHAERLGYFATPCPEALRFPDLPLGRFMFDDVYDTERDVREARACVNLAEMGHEGYRRPIEEYRAELAALETRLEGLRNGTIPALTGADKEARHAERRREIVRAYAARLVAAGVDASWVDIEGAGGSYACADGEEA
jgi:hypothetical protein